MTAIYQTGAPLWLFPHVINVVTALTRNVYGKVTVTSTEETRGRVLERPIELIEAGTRVIRAGATIEILRREGIAISIGTQIQYGSSTYNVIGFTDRPDHQGQVHFWRCDCVKKAMD